MQSVRRRITEIIKETGSATVAELAHELGMAQVSVRHHIDILIGENLVQTIGVRRRNGVGRPSLVYGLTAGAAALFPQRNAQLASSVLSELKAIMPAEAVSGILARVADHMLRGAPAGDLLIQVSVRPHKFFKRKNYDLYCDVPVSFAHAALGGDIEVPTLDGDRVTLRRKTGRDRARRKRRERAFRRREPRRRDRGR